MTSNSDACRKYDKWTRCRRRIIWITIPWLAALSYFALMTVRTVEMNDKQQATIQEQQEILRSLRERQQLVIATLDSSEHGYVALDSRGRVLAWNKAMELWTGYTESEMEGRSLRRIMTADAWEKHKKGYTDGTWSMTNSTIRLDCQILNRNPNVPPMDVQVAVRLMLSEGSSGVPLGVAYIEKKSRIFEIPASKPEGEVQ